MTQESKDLLLIVASFLSGIGTLLLACIAILGRYISELWRRPKISLEVGSTKPLRELVKIEVSSTTKSAEIQEYQEFRIKVTNSGKSPARACVLCVQEIFRNIEGTGTFHKYKEFMPQNLHFVTHHESHDILPGIPAYVTLGQIGPEIANTDNSGSPTATLPKIGLKLLLLDSATTANISLLKGTIIIPITIVFEGVSNPRTKYVEMHWNADSLTKLNETNSYIRLLNKKEFKSKTGTENAIPN